MVLGIISTMMEQLLLVGSSHQQAFGTNSIMTEQAFSVGKSFIISGITLIILMPQRILVGLRLRQVFGTTSIQQMLGHILAGSNHQQVSGITLITTMLML